MSVEATYTNRRTRDILEDYDLALFAYSTTGTTDYPGPIDRSAVAVARSRLLRLLRESWFELRHRDAERRQARTTRASDLVFRKRYSNNWQLLGSYTYNWAKGNTNSDSNADFQGDVLYLDPLAPNTYKQQPGIDPARLQGGGLVHLADRHRAWCGLPLQLGTIASRTALASQRNLPIQVEVPYDYAGVTDYWVTSDAIGSLQNPAWAQLDLRAQYKKRFARLRHGVLRRHLQRVEQSGLDSRPGSGRRRGRHGVR